MNVHRHYSEGVQATIPSSFDLEQQIKQVYMRLPGKTVTRIAPGSPDDVALFFCLQHAVGFIFCRVLIDVLNEVE